MQLYSEKNLRQLKAIRIRFGRNNKRFWKRHKYITFILIIAAALDCISTMHFMLLDGIDREIHPQIWLLSTWLGPIWGAVVGKIAQLVLGIPVTIYVLKYARLIIWTATALYLFAFWHNLANTDFFHLMTTKYDTILIL